MEPVKYILGIDPGVTGALALYDREKHALIYAEKMPTTTVRINRKNRQRIDTPQLLSTLRHLSVVGTEVAVLEAVGGRPMQAASTAYVLGHGVGLLEMGLIAADIDYLTITPSKWKGALGVTGKRGSLRNTQGHMGELIAARALEIFPDEKKHFVGPRGGWQLDVVEAALLAYYGAKFALKTAELKETHG